MFSDVALLMTPQSSTYSCFSRNSFRSHTYKIRSCNSFRFHTYKKQGGGGSPSSSYAACLQPGLSLLCFHIDTNCFFHNSFLLIFMQIAPWGGGVSFKLKVSLLCVLSLPALSLRVFTVRRSLRAVRSPLVLISFAAPHLGSIALPAFRAHYGTTHPPHRADRAHRVYGRRASRPMATLNRKDLDQLERREFQLTIISAVFVFVLAGGLATFMYPLVFVHPEGNKWTLRVAFFGFIALTLLFLGYLFDRQGTVRQLKGNLLAELERNVELRLQGSTDLLQSMPDLNHFWDRLTMEFRRAMTMEKTLSLLLVKSKPGAAGAKADAITASWGDAAKAMSRKLRPTDSIYRLSPDLFGLVLPETDTLNAKRISFRLQEELQAVRAKYGCTFDITAHNYPDQVKSSHELEDIVKSQLPEKEEWSVPAPVDSAPAE